MHAQILSDLNNLESLLSAYCTWPRLGSLMRGSLKLWKSQKPSRHFRRFMAEITLKSSRQMDAAYVEQCTV